MQDVVDIFLGALKNDLACLHPTDTIPGLAFNPRKATGLNTICKFKGRSETKPCIGLVPSLERALAYWETLPLKWHKVLSKLWPGSLSVIWRANKAAPNALVSIEGTISLRVPCITQKEYCWMNEVLAKLEFPLPTTSVNISGQPPATTWKEAVSLVQKEHGIFIPQIEVHGVKTAAAPSTLIKIIDEKKYELLREGAIKKALIDSNLEG